MALALPLLLVGLTLDLDNSFLDLVGWTSLGIGWVLLAWSARILRGSRPGLQLVPWQALLPAGAVGVVIAVVRGTDLSAPGGQRLLGVGLLLVAIPLLVGARILMKRFAARGGDPNDVTQLAGVALAAAGAAALVFGWLYATGFFA